MYYLVIHIVILINYSLIILNLVSYDNTIVFTVVLKCLKMTNEKSKLYFQTNSCTLTEFEVVLKR